MARKKVADMSPAELEEHREYMREAKRKSRENGGSIDKPVKRDRAGYMRMYRANRRKKNKTK